MDSRANADAFINALFEDESQYTTQEVQENVVVLPDMSTKDTRISRGGNFSAAEDIVLVSAWLNTSLDAIHSTDQKSKTFWSRIATYYAENTRPKYALRSDRSLINRWSAIQQAVNKFSGFLAQIEQSRPSGLNEQDKVSQ